MESGSPPPLYFSGSNQNLHYLITDPQHYLEPCHRLDGVTVAVGAVATDPQLQGALVAALLALAVGVVQAQGPVPQTGYQTSFTQGG